MNYEIEGKLNDKVDKWEFNALQQSISNLKSKNDELESSIKTIEGKFYNYNYVINRFIEILIEKEGKETNSIMINELYELKQNL